MADICECGCDKTLTRDKVCPICREDKNGGWISVKDRLPIEETDSFKDYDCIYIIAHRNGDVFPCEFAVGRKPCFWGEFKQDGYNGRLSGITHWMPLPSPPKEDE